MVVNSFNSADNLIIMHQMYQLLKELHISDQTVNSVTHAECINTTNNIFHEIKVMQIIQYALFVCLKLHFAQTLSHLKHWHNGRHFADDTFIAFHGTKIALFCSIIKYQKCLISTMHRYLYKLKLLEPMTSNSVKLEQKSKFAITKIYLDALSVTYLPFAAISKC